MKKTGVKKIVRHGMQCALLVNLLLALLPPIALAADVRRDIEAIYHAIGEGDTAQAKLLSLSLLEQVPQSDAERFAVLQARFDVLAKRTPFAGDEVDALRLAAADFAEHDPRGRALALRIDIATDYLHGNVQGALDRVANALASPEKKAPDEIAELDAAEARAHASLPGQLPQAAASAQRARQRWHAQSGLRARLNESEMYYLIGAVLANTGSQAEALRADEAGAALASANFGADSLARIRIDVERASVLAVMGRHAESLKLHEEMLLASQHHFGAQSLEAAKAEGFIGADLQEIGDYAAARAHYEHVEALLAQLPNAPAYERGLIATNYGNVLQETGEAAAALAHYRQALAAWGDDPATSHARAVVLANIGNTEFRLAHYAEAIADHSQALALREQSDGKDSPGLAYALEGLGAAHLVLQQYSDSEQAYRRAIEVRSRGLAANHPTLAPLNFGLALARWGQGDVDAALALATTTAQYQQSMLATFAADFSERQSVAYRDLLVPATALAVTLAAKRGDAGSVASAWQLVMRERGLVARTEAYRLAGARAQHDPALAGAWRSWQQANTTLAEAWLEPDPGAARLQTLRQQAEAAEREVWQRSGSGHALPELTASTPQALGRALPSDGVLIAYTEGLADDPSRFLAAGAIKAPEDWYAFAMAADGPVQLRRIGAIDTLATQARAWYGALRDPQSNPALLRRDGLLLRHELLDPFVALADRRRVFIVPEGELFRVSFAALPGNHDDYLIETGTRIHTLSHENDLNLTPTSHGAAKLLLAGAPEFPPLDGSAALTSRATCVRAARQGFAAIPNAARELDSLHSLLAQAQPAAQIEMYAGAAASKTKIVAALPQANVIHLATHGFSMDASCADEAPTRGVSLAAAAPDSSAGKTSEDAAGKSADTAALSALSGLAFSGANVRSGSTLVGVLSAGELATLDLSQVDWIALSACDSGLGRITRNEGVFGMRRALRLAGARTVVMSLWQVDDASTAELMQALYRAHFVEHADVPTAMASAMQSVLSARRAAGQSDHPYYWAAFIDEGGWR